MNLYYEMIDVIFLTKYIILFRSVNCSSFPIEQPFQKGKKREREKIKSLKLWSLPYFTQFQSQASYKSSRHATLCFISALLLYFYIEFGNHIKGNILNHSRLQVSTMQLVFIYEISHFITIQVSLHLVIWKRRLSYQIHPNCESLYKKIYPSALS